MAVGQHGSGPTTIHDARERIQTASSSSELERHATGTGPLLSNGEYSGDVRQPGIAQASQVGQPEELGVGPEHPEEYGVRYDIQDRPIGPVSVSQALAQIGQDQPERHRVAVYEPLKAGVAILDYLSWRSSCRPVPEDPFEERFFYRTKRCTSRLEVLPSDIQENNIVARPLIRGDKNLPKVRSHLLADQWCYSRRKIVWFFRCKVQLNVINSCGSSKALVSTKQIARQSAFVDAFSTN